MEGSQAVAESLGGLQAGNTGEGHGAGLYIVYPTRGMTFSSHTYVIDVLKKVWAGCLRHPMFPWLLRGDQGPMDLEYDSGAGPTS